MRNVQFSALFAAFIFPAIANSQTIQDTGKACEAAIAANDTLRIIELAAEVGDFRGFVSPSYAKLGEACLRAATEKEWTYSPEFSRFVTATVLEARARLRRLDTELEEEAKTLDRDSAAISENALAVLSVARDRQLAAMQTLQDAKEARVAARAEQVRAQTLVACETLRAADEIAALTNPVCHAIYIAQGFPED